MEEEEEQANRAESGQVSQEGVEAGGAVPVPEAPREVTEQEDALLAHGERLGAAGRGRAELSLGSSACAAVQSKR